MADDQDRLPRRGRAGWRLGTSAKAPRARIGPRVAHLPIIP